MLENLQQDIRYGIRTLGKNPGFTVIAVLTLALGIGANTAIFSVVENLLLRALPYRQPERLVEIANTYLPQIPRAGLSPGDYADWRRQNASFSEMGACAEILQGFNLSGEGEAQRVRAAYADAGLFPMLGIRSVVGRSFVPEEDRTGSAPVVILGHRLWQSRYGGDPRLVGRSISLDNQRYTVVGVLPAGLQLSRSADLWMPFGQFNDDLTEHVHHAFVAIARLKPGISLAQARDEVGRLYQQEAIAYPDAHRNFGVLVEPIQDAAAARLRTTLLVLFGAVGVVLLIACANLVNLLLVRNATREREVAVRTALGASPWRLIRQLLTESMLLSLFGGALGLLFAVVGLKALLAFVPADLGVLREAGLNGWVLGFTVAICLTAGLACGFLPAVRMLGNNLAGVLKQGSKGSSASGHHRTHNLLVISEIAMALVPLIGAGLLLRSFQRLLEVDPGFRPDHVLAMEIQQARISFAQYNQLSLEGQLEYGRKQARQFEEIAARIRTLPGVKQFGGRNWAFYGESCDEEGKSHRVRVLLASRTPIQRHVKVKAEANPYDPADETYFEKREGDHMAESFRGTRTLRFLWYYQRGLCPICNTKVTRITGWRLHYCVPRVLGGSTGIDNRVLVHPECHDRVHRQRLFVSPPRLPERGVRRA